METTRTIVLKLQPTADQTVELDATLAAFATACDHIADVARQEHTTNKVLIQRVCYREVRATFGLSANLAIRAIARVCAALKVPEKAHSAFKPTSVDYDARIFSFREWDWTVSLTLLNSRERIDTKPGEHQKSALKGTTPTAAQLVKREGRFFLHIQLSGKPRSRSSPTISSASISGSPGSRPPAMNPRGIAASRWKGSQEAQPPTEAAPAERNQGSQEEVRRLAGKEARFRRHENHCISKTIVQSAKDTGRGIALEDLKGIRNRITARGGDARNRLSGWSFHQLYGFLSYKAEDAGIPIVQVDPRNTSRTCSECGHCEKANRRARLCSCASTADSPRTPIGTPPGTSGLWPSKVATELAVVEAKAGNGTAAETSRKATALQCG